MTADQQNNKVRVFVSSVQKELEPERVAAASLMTTDPFLMKHCTPVLFEREPIPPRPAPQPYLECLRGCQVYVLFIFNDYGNRDGNISAVHHEYRLAQKLKLPTLVFLKGTTDDARSPETMSLLGEIKQHKHTYRRFIDREDLKPELRKALLNLLKEEFEFAPSADEAAGGRDQIEAASPFETAPLSNIPWALLDESAVGQFAAQVVQGPTLAAWDPAVCAAMHTRGLLWRRDASVEHYATAAGLLLFGRRPADHFPQCEILADAYADTKISAKPRGQLNINKPVPQAIDQVMEFVEKHTFHPTRVVGINNIALDEYPERALREALVNAMAHRNYEDKTRKISIQVFSDRIVVASPGYPPSPLTLAKLRRGNYRACSRNPVIAQTLATLNLMEQRGSGFARMRDAMLNHGLDAPVLGEEDGYFVVTLPGPNGNYDRLKTPKNAAGLITPAIEAQLNERQRKIVIHVQKAGLVTRGWCVAEFKVANDTAGRDLKELTKLGILSPQGKGRAARYVLQVTAGESTDNRPT